MGTESECSRLPSPEQLRELAAGQGVFPSDEDLQAVLGFLEAILPGLAAIERQLPPDLPPAHLEGPDE